MGPALDVIHEADSARPPGVIPAEHEWVPPSRALPIVIVLPALKSLGFCKSLFCC